MNEMPILGSDNVDKIYLARCLNELKRWGAPLSNWHCDEIVDVREDDYEASLSECDLCGCDRVRYEHHMSHIEFPFPVVVGCICAGIMEGDILKAKERERLIRNRSKRKRHFVEKPWCPTPQGGYVRQYKKHDIYIDPRGETYRVYVDGGQIDRYKGKPITNLLAATYAAFNAIDPEVKCL